MTNGSESDNEEDLSLNFPHRPPTPPTPNSYAAPNFIENGMCNACGTDVDIIQFSVQCFNCKVSFHAVDCFESSYCVSAKTSNLLNTFARH